MPPTRAVVLAMSTMARMPAKALVPRRVIRMPEARDVAVTLVRATPFAPPWILGRPDRVRQLSASSWRTAMSNDLSGRVFDVAVRLKHRKREAAASVSAEPELRLPRLQPCEIAAAAGL